MAFQELVQAGKRLVSQHLPPPAVLVADHSEATSRRESLAGDWYCKLPTNIQATGRKETLGCDW